MAEDRADQYLGAPARLSVLFYRRAMPTFRLPTLPATDAELVAAFQDVVRRLDYTGPTSCAVQFAESGMQPISGSLEQITEHADLRQLLAIGVTAIRTISLQAPQLQNSSFTLVAERMADRNSDRDLVTFSLPDNTANETALRVVGAVRSAFRVHTPTPSLGKLLGSELAQYYEAREDTLRRLETMNRELMRQGVALRAELDERMETERGALRREVTAERERLEAEYRKKDEALAERERALAEQQNALDASSNTQARRKLREDLKKILQARSAQFTLTKATTRKRWPTHVLFAALLFAAAAIAIHALLGTVATPGLYPFLRFVVAVLAFSGAVAFYIRWNDRWAQVHADEEFRLKRLELDVDRASWLVEMALEWKEEKGYQIPASLLERLSANLFVAGDRRPNAQHPAQDIASAIIRSSAGVRLSIPGVGDLTLDRKGIQQLSREIERSDGAEAN